MKHEIRVAKLSLEQREDNKPKRIVGYAAVFDSPTDINGYFIERIAPGAFSETIKNDDVRALIDHDSSKILGRTSAKTLKLSEDDKGLSVEIELPDTQTARDLSASMERGDVDQMSFGFMPEVQEWDDSGDIPIRTLKKVSLFDVSVVTFPAYPDTEAALRSRAKTRNHVFMRRRMLTELFEKKLPQ